VIYRRGEVYLIDWGTAEIDIVPHSELGVLMMKKECSKEEFHCFLEGIGLNGSGYEKIEKEIKVINLLNGCDGFLMYRKIRILKQKEGMSARIVKQDGGKVTIEVDMELNGSMLSQEEAIQLALNEAGKLATRAAAERFDTDGTAITHKGQRLSSKGRKKN